MARRTKSEPVPEDFEEHILDTDIRDEMQTSFLEYAYSVIYSRALPDARDGLKPVQRRILYTMNEMGLRPDRGHSKCARIVGEVMGRLHPHGDGAIYDALVRTAQPWAMRLPMVDGHGNFGSPGGEDPPAAMRYTEARMAPPAVVMTDSIDEDTVDFKPNYDSREFEPTVLPSAIPNLVVNGTTGIAVGMATNMAPHNLVEVVQALRHLIKHPKTDVEGLMRFIPGPDLPTGGKIVGLDGIRDAYETGRGVFKMRATTRIETIGRRKGIVVTELPYGIGTEKVMERIKTLVQAKKIQGIADMKDLTDRENGLRLVIEIKNGFVPEALLEQLYKLTPMEDSFGINNVALVDGQPRTLGLKELLEVFLTHRYEVVRRRSQFRRNKKADRLHLVDGLLLALIDIDEVIQVIRTSDDSASARERLMSVFELSQLQAEYILEMQLRRLTRFSRIELEKEQEQLRREIEELDAILADEGLLKQVVSDELGEVAKTFGTPRRTVLLESAGTTAVAAATASLEVPDDPCFALLSSSGLLARTTSDEQIGTGGGRANHDVVVSAVRTTARADIGVLTSAGRLLRLAVLDLPAIPPSANEPNLQGGLPLTEVLELAAGERALALTSLSDEGPGLALGTRQGVVKRVNPEVLGKDEWEVVRLADGDEVVGAVELRTGTEELCFISSDAQLLHFGAANVRPQGRSGGGMAGIKLAAGAKAVWFGALEPEGAVVVTSSGSATALPGTEPGSVKVTDFAEYPGKGRATGGVRCHRFLKGEDTLVFAWAGTGPARAAAASGAPVDLPPAEGRRDGSGVPVSQPIAAVAGPLATALADAGPRTEPGAEPTDGMPG
ncbi:DNA topoisomerase IV subunit A [Nocardioides sp. zg-536]|uniref:DNA topoisomerase (ATP-hydrolyzing) n=1 Tax=Nocardioides faecalis TaxID=2803858 RepID=A0A938Y8R0_9ACTN|nr:DNA topoisomerase IV subunit A [Nocardioides faecalis]MBM9460238.1 DNA topoisomerase IV subunit A [Nocardioides faecalis]MBS4754640.1 DNA topoisomerase IV subunit A [Nocardioides faecalis]QVI59974.1 DNA topoisomerase IV subunit A [Nocardioides faecalis]